MADFEEELDEASLAEAAYFEELMGKTLEDILREGQKLLFAQLVTKCRSGKANHQELAILRNVLKDNGLTLGIPPEDGDAAVRRSPEPVDLPDFDKPEYMQ